MEAKTCEQYVLGELEEARTALERLAAENDRLQAQIVLLESQLGEE